MKHNSSYFVNKDCKYYPCHADKDGNPLYDINCMFCYCPLYFTDCPGYYVIDNIGFKYSLDNVKIMLHSH